MSPDDIESHRAFKAKNSFPYPLLIDEGHQVADAYDVWALRDPADPNSGRNVRSHFVIDENGRLLDCQYQVTPEESVERGTSAVTGE